MDGSEGHQVSHAHNANEIENNDEHWLWTHVDRIKRSIESVLGSGNVHGNKRVKRDWSWGWSDDTTETPSPQETTTASFSFFSLFGNNEETTTPKDDQYHQNDSEEETTNQEDLDIDLTDGSGLSRYDEPRDVEGQYCELQIFIFLSIMN